MALVECEISDDAYIVVFDTEAFSFIISQKPDYIPPVVTLNPISSLKIWH